MEVIMAVCRLIALNSIKNIVLYAMVLSLFSCASGGSGSEATMSWVAPAEREDGTPLALSEISGYRIYYGTKSGVYQGQIYIDDGSATQKQLSGIPSGTYYAVVTTIDTEGRESQYSSEIVVTI
jgi:hypothetical protein